MPEQLAVALNLSQLLSREVGRWGGHLRCIEAVKVVDEGVDFPSGFF